MKKVIFLVFAVVGLISMGSIADAQLLIEKSRVELDVRPGVTIADTMTLHNRSNKAIGVKVYWQDFHYLPPYRGKKEFLPGGTSEKYSMNTWVTFSPNEFVLAPQSSKDIDYTIKVPKDVKGGHYGVLFFEQGESKTMEGTGLNVVTRLGALFFIDSVNRSKQMQASDLRLAEGKLSGTLRNQGDVYMFPKGQYYMIDQEGLVVDRRELDKIYLPPDAETDYEIELPDHNQGAYTLILTFDLDDGDSITREIDFETAANGRIQIRAQRN